MLQFLIATLENRDSEQKKNASTLIENKKQQRETTNDQRKEQGHCDQLVEFQSLAFITKCDEIWKKESKARPSRFYYFPSSRGESPSFEKPSGSS